MLVAFVLGLLVLFCLVVVWPPVLTIALWLACAILVTLIRKRWRGLITYTSHCTQKPENFWSIMSLPRDEISFLFEYCWLDGPIIAFLVMLVAAIFSTALQGAYYGWAITSIFTPIAAIIIFSSIVLAPLAHSRI